MKPSFYAFLVGINDYRSPSKPLRGCVNDVKMFASFLRQFTASRFDLNLKILTDDRATRQAILDGFRLHLGQAGPGDTALFYFAGHGSQEPTPEPYAAMEADGLDETLVAYDSRQPGCWDLADKELAVLIAEVAVAKPHVVVILDSCHSGTATRADEDGRRTAANRRQRPAETFWFWGEKDLPRTLGGVGGWQLLPSGRHVLLTACRDFELAREKVMADNRLHGIFSYQLVQTLKALGPNARYHDLHKQLQAQVHHLNPNQLPQAAGCLEERVFDGALGVKQKKLYRVRRVRDLGWRMDAGALHGLQAGSRLKIWRADSEEAIAEPLASARITCVDPSESTVELTSGDLPAGMECFPASLAEQPIKPLQVCLESPISNDDLTEAIQKSPYLGLNASEPDVIVRKGADGLSIRRRFAYRERIARFERILPEGIVHALEHMARWQMVADLQNPGSPLAGKIRMTIHPWHHNFSETHPPTEIESSEGIHLPYRSEGRTAKPRPARFAVRLENHSEKPLFFALLALDENFAVRILAGAYGRLPAGRTFWVRSKQGIPAVVPDNLHARGVTRRTDTLVLMSSEVDADWTLLDQGRIDLACERGESPEPGSARLLSLLSRRADWRELDDMDDVPMDDQWSVEKQLITAERPAPIRYMKRQKRGGNWSQRISIELVEGLRLEAPKILGGWVQPHGLPEVTRRLGEAWRPRSLNASLRDFRPVILAGALGSDSGLIAVELGDINASTVSAESSLVLHSAIDLEANEQAIVLAFDGEKYHEVGCSRKSLPGLMVEYLPECKVDRSSGLRRNSLWLFVFAEAKALLGTSQPSDRRILS